jgi:actin-like ATPase involved in cell morphogenesis
LVYLQGRGIVLDEPSVVAIDVRDGSPLAVGLEAKAMIGRAPAHILAVRPLRDGVIANFEICEKMLAYFIRRVHPGRLSKPDMVICVPSGVTGVGEGRQNLDQGFELAVRAPTGHHGRGLLAPVPRAVPGPVARDHVPAPRS